MNRDEFDLLAAKALSDEASPEELSRLHAALMKDPALQAEYADLEQIWKLARSSSHRFEELGSETAAIPAARLAELRAVVQNKFPVRERASRSKLTWWDTFCWPLLRSPLRLALGVIAVCAVVAGLSWNWSDRERTAQKASVSIPARRDGALQYALTTNPDQIDPARLLVVTRSVSSIPLYSPIPATTNLSPAIIWKSEPGKTYEVLISDELDPRVEPWRAGAVASPLHFASVESWRGRPLPAGGIYRIRISESGAPLNSSEYTFRTIGAGVGSIPAESADRVQFARTIVESNPELLGDALAILLTLPPELADSLRALRLKLFLYGQLGYRSEFQEVLERLQKK
jgi:hypothetical protein